MSKPIILCVDDQREILAALIKDLDVFTKDFEIQSAESASEADELMQQYSKESREMKLIICDHIMPGENGIDLLARINKDDRFSNIRKILLTGLATQQDTIRAINEAQIDIYLEKPWDPKEIVSAINQLKL